MTDAPTPFDWLGDAVAERTALSRAEARGMVRVVLRDCGLQVESLTTAQVRVVLARAMEGALARVKVERPKEVCADLLRRLDGLHLAPPALHDAADVFSRMGR